MASNNTALLNFFAASLFAEISGMNAENNQRMLLGESMAYVEEDYLKALNKYTDMAEATSDRKDDVE